MQRIVDLGLVSGQCALLRAGKILPVDIAFEVARLDLIAVHLALMVGPSAAYDLHALSFRYLTSDFRMQGVAQH